MTETMTGRLSENLDKKIRTEIPNLPFIKQNDGQIVFWSVRPSGDYAKDCRTGREYGALALEHMVKADFSPFLTWCIMDMPRKKDCSGIEVGFLEFFAEIASSKASKNERFRLLEN
jgi:hypothetical protein